mmetsp:Transcript_59132/g.106310  ORF Transcript_59132/g.106310 Transcript_59132/m.106310 type:complete len:121 (+) Transcript_59132:335-697(+)
MQVSITHGQLEDRRGVQSRPRPPVESTEAFFRLQSGCLEAKFAFPVPLPRSIGRPVRGRPAAAPAAQVMVRRSFRQCAEVPPIGSLPAISSWQSESPEPELLREKSFSVAFGLDGCEASA